MKNLEDLAKFPSENPNPVLRVTKEKVIYTNKAGEELFNTNEGCEVPDLLKVSIIKALDTNKIVTTDIVMNNHIFSFDIIPISKEKYANIYGKNITDKKEKEISELQEKKLSLANAQRIAHIGNWDWDIVKNELYWSDEIYRIFGLKPLEFDATYEAFVDTIHPDDRELVQISVDEALSDNKPYNIDHRIVLPNGSIRIVHEQAEVNFDEAGKAIKMVGTVQDITDRKRAEEKLRKSEEKFHLLFDTIPDALYIIDQETGKILDVNKAAEKMYGYSREEWLQMKNTDVSAEPDKTKNATRKTLKQIPIRYHKKKDGTVFPLEMMSSSYILGDQRLIIATGRDITERKKSEEELIRYRDHLEELVKERTKALKESETKHKMLSKELELILDHIIGPVFYKDTKNCLIWVNKYTADAYKMKREDLIGKSLFELYPEELAQIYWDADLKVINSGKPTINIEEPWETVDGLKWVLTTKIPYIDEMGEIKGIIGTSLDITKRKLTEIELQKSELTYHEAYDRAEFYKDIFTHDINNILQNILNGVLLNEMYLNKPEKSTAIKEINEMIKNQIKRGANLVSNIRKLSKISESEVSLVKTNCFDVLKKSIRYIKNAFQEKNIKIEFLIIENNFKILANELLEDVFENILINSINYNDSEAINIEVKITKELKQGINYIKFQFIDNGIGITDKRKKKIFIRGYSEETSVHGMGLGLSLVKKIIDSYNGEIWMEDRVKGDYTKGNNCVILIPALESSKL